MKLQNVWGISKPICSFSQWLMTYQRPISIGIASKQDFLLKESQNKRFSSRKVLQIKDITTDKHTIALETKQKFMRKFAGILNGKPISESRANYFLRETSFISKATQDERKESLDYVWSKIKESGISLTTRLWNTKVYAHLINEDNVDPFELLMKIQESSDPNNTTFNGLLQICVLNGDIEAASKIGEWMVYRGYLFDDAHLALLVQTFSKRNDTESIQNIMLNMKKFRVRPKSKSYSALLNHYARLGDLDGIHRAMIEASFYHEYPSTKMLLGMLDHIIKEKHFDVLPTIWNDIAKNVNVSTDLPPFVQEKLGQGDYEDMVRLMFTVFGPKITEEIIRAVEKKLFDMLNTLGKEREDYYDLSKIIENYLGIQENSRSARISEYLKLHGNSDRGLTKNIESKQLDPISMAEKLIKSNERKVDNIGNLVDSTIKKMLNASRSAYEKGRDCVQCIEKLLQNNIPIESHTMAEVLKYLERNRLTDVFAELLDILKKTNFQVSQIHYLQMLKVFSQLSSTECAEHAFVKVIEGDSEIYQLTEAFELLMNTFGSYLESEKEQHNGEECAKKIIDLYQQICEKNIQISRNVVNICNHAHLLVFGVESEEYVQFFRQIQEKYTLSAYMINELLTYSRGKGSSSRADELLKDVNMDVFDCYLSNNDTLLVIYMSAHHLKPCVAIVEASNKKKLEISTCLSLVKKLVLRGDVENVKRVRESMMRVYEMETPMRELDQMLLLVYIKSGDIKEASVVYKEQRDTVDVNELLNTYAQEAHQKCDVDYIEHMIEFSNENNLEVKVLENLHSKVLKIFANSAAA